MVVRSSSAAQIHLILASDDWAEVRQIERDLKTSKYVYAFTHLDKSDTVISALKRNVLDTHVEIPAVVVINYPFAGPHCAALVELVRDAAKTTAIECVVTHPPADNETREKLSALGARVFDEEEDSLVADLSVH